MTNPFRIIDQFTIEQIQILAAEAERRDMAVDWETASLIPRKYANMSHHQRDAVAQQETRRLRYSDQRDQKDNDPASPQEADWE